jgi:8-amino-7-oxononanoate synthase
MPWRSHIEAQHRKRTASAQWRQRQIVNSPQASVVTIDGREYQNFSSNDYLGLANDDRLKQAAIAAAQAYGVGSGASHLICGHHAAHDELEKRIAGFMSAEKAIVFSTGYMANLAVSQAFVGRDDFVFQDKLNHASLIDAGRSCDGKLKRYAHADTNDLKKLLEKHPDGRKLIMTDGVFSMDGDVAPITELERIADKHSALLLIDEAHGFGVMGDGRGSAAAVNVRPQDNVLIMGTLGKAAGSFGAFVAGDALLIEHLIQFGRTYIYTTAIPPHVAATTAAAIQIIDDMSGPALPQGHDSNLLAELHANIHRFKSAIANGPLKNRFLDSPTPIQPMVVGDEAAALAASEHLREKGFLVTAIRPPTVPTGSSRLRITLTATHTPAAIASLVDVLHSDALRSVLAESLPIESE